jgi:hypothetical protein
MKPTLLFSFCCSTALMALVSAGLAVQGAPTPVTAPKAAAKVETNAPAPVSVFVMPRTPQDGRDPFFPHSMRPYGPIAPVQTNAPAIVAAIEVRLNGISGSSEHRLAIINNRTFDKGEEAEIVSGSTRSRIRCLEIKTDSVIIQLIPSGERREIRMRGGV